MIWIGLLIIFVMIIIISMVFQSYRYKINLVTIQFRDLPDCFDNTKILLITDIHSRKLDQKLLKLISEKHPVDFVFIGGDLVERGVPLEQARANLKKLTIHGPTFFVWGNHDEQYDSDQLENLLKEEKVKILNNETVLLRKTGSDNLWLIGIGDVCSKKDRLEVALENVQTQPGFRILLSHVPTITRKIKPEHQIALVLSGHTHGGQIALPWIGPVTGGVGEFFPKIVVGYHDLGFTKLYISSGFGTSHLPLRLFTRPEVVVLKLVKLK